MYFSFDSCILIITAFLYLSFYNFYFYTIIRNKKRSFSNYNGMYSNCVKNKVKL